MKPPEPTLKFLNGQHATWRAQLPESAWAELARTLGLDEPARSSRVSPACRIGAGTRVSEVAALAQAVSARGRIIER
jgi:hypothetical protein